MNKDHAKWFFLCFFIASVIVFGLLLNMFWVPMGLGAVIALTCNPVYQMVLKRMRYRYIAAAVMTLSVFLVVLVPMGAIMAVLVSQVIKFSQMLSLQLQDGSLATIVDQIGRTTAGWLSLLTNSDVQSIDLRASLIGFLKDAVQSLYQYSPKVLSSTFHIFLNSMLCLFFTFVFFADGGQLYGILINALPISISHENQIMSQVRQMVTATLLGMIVNAIMNGLLIGLAFWVCGLPKPVLWGIVAIGFSLIPVVGAFIIWGGGVVVLLLQGQMHFALGLMAYGLIIIAQTDNVVKPIVMRGKVNIHPALLMMCLLGGMQLFGPSGLVFGPVMLSLIVATLRIYQQEYAPRRA
ncbi:MAG: hypothetical protein COV45_06860 [Deltaproteobacteria bacterium CG11_big_fil_rev_8_21_14_0_20_47_16]|nr:MAG: hypothetical protein COV45_06860 [Deltaproteobacteria bacterium CG11_big_fil_rev_8_21_14_0_20_47_16]